jgi:hypothetical protein
LSLVQWAAEPADPQVFARYLVSEPLANARPRDVLMVQGIVDHYILPDIANALSLAIGLDLAGPARDADNAELAADLQTPLATLLPLAGRRALALPASGNLVLAGAHETAVVVQWPGDGVEDGHEVIFQTDAPKLQYRCFLQSFARGAASVPAGGPADGACN